MLKPSVAPDTGFQQLHRINCEAR